MIALLEYFRFSFKYIKSYFLIFTLLLIIDTLFLSLSIFSIIPLTNYFSNNHITNNHFVTMYFNYFLDFLFIEKTLFAYGLLFVFANIFKAISGLIILNYTTVLRYKILIKLKKVLLDNLFLKNLNFFYSAGLGKLTNTLHNEILRVTDGAKSLSQLIQQITQILFLFSVALYLDFKFSIYFFLINFVIFFSFIKINSIVKDLGSKQLEKMNMLVTITNETLQMFKLISFFDLSKIVLKRNLEITSTWSSYLKKYLVISEIPNLFYKPLSVLSILIILTIVDFENNSKVDNYIVLFWTFFSMIPLITAVNRNFLTINNIQPSLRQIKDLQSEVLNQKDNFLFNKSDIIKVDFTQRLQFDNVSFKFPKNKFKILNLSFKILKNQNIAIVGKSGSGKSVILDLILGFYKPCNGNIYIDSQNYLNLNKKSFSSIFSFCPQEDDIFFDTIRNNITLFNKNLSDTEIISVIKKLNMDTYLKETSEKLDTIIGHKESKMSGGQIKRLCLARAFLRKSEILVLDEPTSSLDSLNEEIIKSELIKIHKTKIIVSHKKSFVDFCDFIYVVDNGIIVEEGTYDQLSENKKSQFNLLLK
jgi:ABC-type multidrug transport system fused ATPase/permease subunit